MIRAIAPIRFPPNENYHSIRGRFLIETRSLPKFAHCFPHCFTFYVSPPIRSIETRSPPGLLAPTPRHLPPSGASQSARFFVLLTSRFGPSAFWHRLARFFLFLPC